MCRCWWQAGSGGFPKLLEGFGRFRTVRRVLAGSGRFRRVPEGGRLQFWQVQDSSGAGCSSRSRKVLAQVPGRFQRIPSRIDTQKAYAHDTATHMFLLLAIPPQLISIPFSILKLVRLIFYPSFYMILSHVSSFNQ